MPHPLEQAKALWLSHSFFDSIRDLPEMGLVEQEVERFSGREWVADHQTPLMPDLERLHRRKCR
ncbi:hypothetical protein C1T17_02525 [Sphingobium sp. SCG-1]|nr:hypothetical protein C1T17_02525 [Sphingobium sp. SCG-1]